MSVISKTVLIPLCEWARLRQASFSTVHQRHQHFNFHQCFQWSAPLAHQPNGFKELNKLCFETKALFSFLLDFFLFPSVLWGFWLFFWSVCISFVFISCPCSPLYPVAFLFSDVRLFPSSSTELRNIVFFCFYMLFLVFGSFCVSFFSYFMPCLPVYTEFLVSDCRLDSRSSTRPGMNS